MNPELRSQLAIDSFEGAAGGCIHQCYRVRIRGRALFLKTNAAQYAQAFDAEADGLAALRAAGARVPTPVSSGVAAGQAYLLLEYLELNGRKDFAALGRMLAQMHREPGPRFGWSCDNYIGATPQENGWCDDWVEFWMERRMRPQIELAGRNGFKLELPNIGLLKNHKPAPSLLHGDLWSGNAGFAAEGPVVFDPAGS
jgi:protein-ribulosamine 3-kinase